jgi:hypothetical protein
MGRLTSTRLDFDMSQLWLLGLSDCEPADFLEIWYETHLDRRSISILARCFQRESVFWHFIKVRVAVTTGRMLGTFSVRPANPLLKV